MTEPDGPVLGVDGCRGGRVGVLLGPEGSIGVHCAPSIDRLVGEVHDEATPRVVAIDIPIGLPDRGVRQADVLARRELAGRAASVFTTLTRAAYEASTYAEARAANVAATGGRSASAQAYALREKILDVDRWIRSPTAPVGHRPEVIEVHPELSFARMAGAVIAHSKKSPEGVRAERPAARRHPATGMVDRVRLRRGRPSRRLRGRLDRPTACPGRVAGPPGHARGLRGRYPGGDAGLTRERVRSRPAERMDR